jgi:hypothetical protein
MVFFYLFFDDIKRAATLELEILLPQPGKLRLWICAAT